MRIVGVYIEGKGESEICEHRNIVEQCAYEKRKLYASLLA